MTHTTAASIHKVTITSCTDYRHWYNPYIGHEITVYGPLPDMGHEYRLLSTEILPQEDIDSGDTECYLNALDLQMLLANPVDASREHIRQSAANIVADFDTIDTMTRCSALPHACSISSLVTVTTNLYDRIQRNIAEIVELYPQAFKS